MDRFDRIAQLHRILRSHRLPIPLTEIQQQLECSERTARRYIKFLQENMGAPLEFDRARSGWHYLDTPGGPFELPGFWFTPSELYALLLAQRLLTDIQPGVLDSAIAPVQRRIEGLLSRHVATPGELTKRIRILTQAARPVSATIFRDAVQALLQRKKMRVFYHGRERDKTTEREISPQRLIHYRSNWYLDAWCHERDGLRSFSLDRLHINAILDDAADEVAEQTLDDHFGPSYGIFAGAPKAVAVLRFTEQRARWVADEKWHPDQQGKVLPDGRFELRVPYSDSRELMMDVLKYGSDVEVLGPEELRAQVMEAVRKMGMVYGEQNGKTG